VAEQTGKNEYIIPKVVIIHYTPAGSEVYMNESLE
jgi:hypothetical protein